MLRNVLTLFCMSAALAMVSPALAARSAAPVAQRATAVKKAAPAKKTVVTKLYTARVTSKTPLLVGLSIDQSGSNKNSIADGEVHSSKAAALAHALNQNIEAMVAASVDGASSDTGEPLFKPWFHIAGVGYSTGTRPLFGTTMQIHSTAELAKAAQWLDVHGNPASKAEDYVSMKWVDPVHEGYTHMGEGFAALLPLFTKFVAEHPDAPAPIAMHFTDGRPEGGNLQHHEMAKALRALKTKDGNVILCNIHVGETGKPFMFPNAKAIDKLPEDQQVDARRLFEMSSPMPTTMIARARVEFPEYKIPDDARMMVYNANGAVLGKLLEMGTVQNMQSRK